ncbi:MAG TPA: alpha/beta hydrolase [Deltaproteobacteria bacterium]|nr:alpha/beta hydrolase [Deltaproteobacteria bacterium]
MKCPAGEIKGVEYREEFVAVADAVRLKVMIFKQTAAQGKAPVIFVAGWISAFSGWIPVIRELAAERDVYYLETREKYSAVIDPNVSLTDEDFSIFQSAKDIVKICEHFKINTPATIACGSSLGATSLLEALKNSRLKAGGAFLVGPNSEFVAPRSLLWILSLPAGLYHPLKYFLVWYLRRFRVDAEKEPQQMQRYIDALNTVEPQRLKHSARSVILEKYQVWNDLDTIRVPVAVAYAPTDKLHDLDNIFEIARRLPCGKLIPCPSNLYMHSEELISDINAFERDIHI